MPSGQSTYIFGVRGSLGLDYRRRWAVSNWTKSEKYECLFDSWNARISWDPFTLFNKLRRMIPLFYRFFKHNHRLKLCLLSPYDFQENNMDAFYEDQDLIPQYFPEFKEVNGW